MPRVRGAVSGVVGWQVTLSELTVRVRELQAALQAHGLPLPSVPGPIRGRRAYWAPPDAAAPYGMLQPQPPPQPQHQPQPHPQHQPQLQHQSQSQHQPQHSQPAYPLYAGGLEALANAALPNMPQAMPVGVSPMNASAIGDLTTPLHTSTPVTPAVPMDPDIAAALDVLNFPAYNWRPYDDDTISLSALFTLDDIGEDANDADFVPPTSPKGESSDSESDGEGDADAEAEAEAGPSSGRKKARRAEAEETERSHKRAKVASAAATPETPDDDEPEEEAEDEPEDLFLPIEDVPIPEDQLYADAMNALGVSTPAELVVVVSKIVETASRGGVTPEQVEGLRRLMRLAEARNAGASNGARSSSGAADGGSREREGRDGDARRR